MKCEAKTTNKNRKRHNKNHTTPRLCDYGQRLTATTTKNDRGRWIQVNKDEPTENDSYKLTQREAHTLRFINKRDEPDNASKKTETKGDESKLAN